MELIEIILLLTIILLSSNIIHHYVPVIPDSLIQVTLGCLLAVIFGFNIHLSSDWFLLLFIAPLLFNDGRRFPKDDLWELRWPIFANSILLVFITMILGGLVIYKMIPSMPLPVAFALAAILSPTDPIAVESIAKKAKLPKNILHLVNGESLINDASGLIGFKYAVAATVYGSFSLKGAVTDFFYISIVGGVIGIITMLFILFIRKFLYEKGLTNVPFNIVSQIASPFLIYMLAEEVFHASGVIAVVTAGIIYHLKSSKSNASSAELDIMSEHTWDVIIYLLNGIVFIILGIEVPFAMGTVVKSMQFNTWISIGYAIITWLVLLIIRIAWIMIYEAFTTFISEHRFAPIDIKTAVIAGLSGVRGAITMAGVLSIPFVTNQGIPFPDRALILFIASIVIILSLLAAVIILPLIPSDNNQVIEYNNNNYLNEGKTRIYMLNFAIDSIKKHSAEDKHISNVIIDQYQMIIKQFSMTHISKMEKDIRLAAIKYEKVAIKKLMAQGQISKKMINAVNYEINHREIKNLNQSNQSNAKLELVSSYQTLKLWLFKQNNDEEINKQMRKILIKINSYTIENLKQLYNKYDEDVVETIIDEYLNYNEALKTSPINYDARYRKIRVRALGAQRIAIQELLNDEKIDWKTASDLRQEINYLENLELDS
ncbi:sodium:proton antiporter [Apilactobacillus micheneri]|uniref:cation:proton antiporter n=1 Tax=Apilactobacillus micheneri TaxID=1899430 RepID=UPI00112A0907|nr:sodium:proton antiporter [Apilactobacillus micheneri]TPR43986.1 sodium:proton antiporter [Apilactobacillus micheneri]TPR47729.1 sodium:proton antiporter [Apilactobacillus micheneri]